MQVTSANVGFVAPTSDSVDGTDPMSKHATTLSQPEEGEQELSFEELLPASLRHALAASDESKLNVDSADFVVSDQDEILVQTEVSDENEILRQLDDPGDLDSLMALKPNANIEPHFENEPRIDLGIDLENTDGIKDSTQLAIEVPVHIAAMTFDAQVAIAANEPQGVPSHEIATEPAAGDTMVQGLQNDEDSPTKTNVSTVDQGKELATSDGQGERSVDTANAIQNSSSVEDSEPEHRATGDVDVELPARNEASSPKMNTQVVMTQTQHSQAATATNSSFSTIATDPVSASIANQVSDHLISARQLVKDGFAKLEVTLDPPELGRITIELTEVDHQISGRLIVSENTTLDSIKQSLPAMFDSLSESGLSLDNFQLENFSQNEQNLDQNDEHLSDIAFENQSLQSLDVSYEIRHVDTDRINVLA